MFLVVKLIIIEKSENEEKWAFFKKKYFKIVFKQTLSGLVFFKSAPRV